MPESKESTANTGNPLYNELDRLRGVVGEQCGEIFELKRQINKFVLKQLAHSEYEDVGAAIGVMVAAKQKAYGDAFGKAGDVLRMMYPHGISPEQYGDVLAVTRIIDKLFRIATDRDAMGESPYRDIAGYGILGVSKEESHK